MLFYVYNVQATINSSREEKNNDSDLLTENHIKNLDMSTFMHLASSIDINNYDFLLSNVILMLGATGEGKSTTTAYLLGMKMKEEEFLLKNANDNPFGKRSKKVIDTDTVSFSEKKKMIGHTLKSCTIFPKCYPVKEKSITICDCPGFFDKKGLEQDFLTTLAIKKVVNQSKKIQSLAFVVSKPSLEASRGKIFYEIMQTLQYMFYDPYKYIDSIFLLFTKTNNWSKNDFGVCIWEIKEEIEQKNKLGKIDEKGVNANHLVSKLLEALIENYEKSFIVIDPLKHEQVNTILSQISNSNGIKREAFLFIGSKAVFSQLSRAYSIIAKEGLELLGAKKYYQKHIEYLKRSIIKDSDHYEEKANKDTLSLFDTCIEEQEIKKENEKLLRYKKSILDKKKEIAKLDTEEPVACLKPIYITPDKMEHKKEKQYCYTIYHNIGFPYVSCEIINKNKVVSMKIKSLSKNMKLQGVYKNIFYCNEEEKSKVDVEIKFFACKKYVNEDKIRSFKFDLDRLEYSLKDCEEKIKYLKEDINLKESFKSMQIKNTNQELKKAITFYVKKNKNILKKQEQEIKDFKEKLLQVEYKLTEKKIFFNFIVDTYKLFLPSKSIVHDFVQRYSEIPSKLVKDQSAKPFCSNDEKQEEEKVCKNILSDKEINQPHLAAQNSHKDVCQLIITKYPKELVDIILNNGCTLLHLAAYNGDVDACELLTYKYPNLVNEVDKKGWTSLHFAARNGHKAVCQLLISKYPELAFQKKEDSWTSLHLAAYNGYKALCQLLVSKFPKLANIEVETGDFKGYNAYQLAIKRKHKEIARLVKPCTGTFQRWKLGGIFS